MLPSLHLQANVPLRTDHIIPPVLNKSQHGKWRGTVGITDVEHISLTYTVMDISEHHLSPDPQMRHTFNLLNQRILACMH